MYQLEKLKQRVKHLEKKLKNKLCVEDLEVHGTTVFHNCVVIDSKCNETNLLSVNGGVYIAKNLCAGHITTNNFITKTEQITESSTISGNLTVNGNINVNGSDTTSGNVIADQSVIAPVVTAKDQVTVQNNITLVNPKATVQFQGSHSSINFCAQDGEISGVSGIHFPNPNSEIHFAGGSSSIQFGSNCGGNSIVMNGRNDCQAIYINSEGGIQSDGPIESNEAIKVSNDCSFINITANQMQSQNQDTWQLDGTFNPNVLRIDSTQPCHPTLLSVGNDSFNLMSGSNSINYTNEEASIIANIIETDDLTVNKVFQSNDIATNGTVSITGDLNVHGNIEGVSTSSVIKGPTITDGRLEINCGNISEALTIDSSVITTPLLDAATIQSVNISAAQSISSEKSITTEGNIIANGPTSIIEGKTITDGVASMNNGVLNNVDEVSSKEIQAKSICTTNLSVDCKITTNTLSAEGNIKTQGNISATSSDSVIRGGTLTDNYTHINCGEITDIKELTAKQGKTLSISDLNVSNLEVNVLQACSINSNDVNTDTLSVKEIETDTVCASGNITSQCSINSNDVNTNTLSVKEIETDTVCASGNITSKRSIEGCLINTGSETNCSTNNCSIPCAPNSCSFPCATNNCVQPCSFVPPLSL
jgi:hypothetical protein